MPRELLHICGPFSIQSYGLAIASGLVLFLLFASQHPWRKRLLSQEAFFESMMIGIGTGLVGGRLLYVVQNYHEFGSLLDIFRVWDGGFAVLGSVLGILLSMPFYLRKRHIPVLPYFDLIALFAPLLQSVSRLGCFFAGCCYGKPCTLAWSVTYTDSGSLAPLGIAIHPTQLYSSLLLFCIFILFYFVAQKRIAKAGQLLAAYLICAGLERFLVDFWRADREYFSFDIRHTFSSHQYIALALVLAGLMLLKNLKNTPTYYSR